MLYGSTGIPTDRPDFATHLKYASRLAKLTNGLTATCSIKPALDKKKIANLQNKLKLVELTKQSIKDEYEIVQFDKEYSTASVLWLPIKTYYLTYHMLCTIEYLLSGDEASLSAKHYKCMDTFTKKLADGTLKFSEPLLNTVFDKSILNFRESRGAHLKTGVPDEDIYKLLMKKVATDKIENYKIANGIPDVRSAKNKERVEKFKNTLTVSIFDFFHLMRLRMNYRNFDFIDDVSSTSTKTYFEQYYKASGYFYTSLNNLKNKIIADISVGS
jgi:hypothetical protein